MTLWMRQTELSVGPQGEKGRAWTDLRVGWRVKHKQNANPATAKIKVYNLADKSIDFIREDKKVARLRTGHKTPVQIFIGYIQKTQLDHKKGDRILVIEASDKAFEGHKKFIQKTFPAGMLARDVFKQLADEAGIEVGRIQMLSDKRIQQIHERTRLKSTRASRAVAHKLDFVRDVVLEHTITLNRRAKEALEEVAELFDVRMWTNDSKLYVRPKDNPVTRSIEVTKLSAQNGTLFSVEPKKDGKIKVRAILKPEIRPGTLFALDHDRYGGGWVARDVTFIGDSGWNDKYEVRITAAPRS